MVTRISDSPAGQGGDMEDKEYYDALLGWTFLDVRQAALWALLHDAMLDMVTLTIETSDGCVYPIVLL